MTDLGWWAISGETVLESLRRVSNGEDPDLVYLELEANAQHDNVNPGGAE